MTSTNQVNQVLTMNNYELSIISQDEVSKGKALKQYDLNGEKVVGCYENEPFLIQFKNKTWNRVAVRISVDGTDVCTGNLADTSAIGEMWIVAAYGTLELKCWPETNKGGSEFVFGKTEDSVAVNTHGVKTGIGYVACAIFTEEVQNNGTWISNWPSNTISIPLQQVTWANNTATNTSINFPSYNGISINSAGNIGINSAVGGIYSAQTLGNYGAMQVSDVCEASCSVSSPAVGAGEYVDQEITKVAGLNKPILATTICIKYEWWVSLRSKIRQNNNKTNNPAFPGDNQVEKMIDLKNTPRKKKGKKVSNEVKYPELNRFG